MKRISYLVLVFLLLYASLFTFHVQAKLENGMAADVVVGQPDFTTGTANTGGISARTLNFIVGVHSDGKRLAIGDDNNHRVLLWNSIPEQNFTPADVVVGQPDFVSAVADNGGRSARTLRFPQNMIFARDKFIIGDQGNRRTLIWNQIPTRNFQPSNVVVGSLDFTNITIGATASLAARMVSVASDGQRLIVSDRENNRILIWNTIPTQIGQPADVVVGQQDFNSTTAGLSRLRLSNPANVSTDGTRLVVSDVGNIRVLIWNKIPTENYSPADVVVGQKDFTSNETGVGRFNFAGVNNIDTDGERLFVLDQSNHRVLIWNKIPTENFAPADFVLGQPDFQSNTANNSGISARSFDAPSGVVYFGTKLAVADRNNSRVLIFNIGAPSGTDLGPQFLQGKAVVGKVFFDWNGNGKQDYFGPPSLELRRGSSRVAREDFDGNGRQN